MIEPVRAASHERHQQSACYIQSSRKLILLQALADVTQQREIHKQTFNLSAPLPEPALDVAFRHRCRRRLRALRNLVPRLPARLLDSLLHGLTRLLREIFLLLLCHTLSGTGHSLLHILVALVDDLLYPLLRLERLEGLLPVAIEEHKQI